jgi:hypothetical protein
VSLSLVLALRDGVRLGVWPPGEGEQACTCFAGRPCPIPRAPWYLELSKGDVLVIRGDVRHCGAGGAMGPEPEQGRERVHAHVEVPGHSVSDNELLVGEAMA